MNSTNNKMINIRSCISVCTFLCRGG